MLKPVDVLMVGVGGQGTILASRILAHAALEKGYDIKVSEIHGMAQRGGSVVTQIRLGKKVFSPLIPERGPT
ncbi:MAG: 2-oxoacid:acceptor oxidoreductase family protein [Candidatus Syntrophopropionicum ammoniitolerans]